MRESRAVNEVLSNATTAAVDSERAGDDNYIALRGVTKHFDGMVAVNGVDLCIRRGELFVLLGASGSGKTTLLRMLAGFEQPSSGDISLEGHSLIDLPANRRPFNLMFQSYALFPHMTVEQNIAFGLRQERISRAQVAVRVSEMLDCVQMTPFRRRRPHQLSGGQQQRVALARCLAKRPKLLLLDEPMAALDKNLRGRMQLEVANIIESLGVTCVMVTHDQDAAMTMADRIAIMEAGRILQVGTPGEIYERPNCRYTAQFVGSVNLFDGVVTRLHGDVVEIASHSASHPLRVRHGVNLAIGQAVSAALRPERILLHRQLPSQEHNREAGVVEDIAYLGSHSVYHIRLDTGLLVSVTAMNDERQAGARLTWHDRVWVCWDEHAMTVLPI